MIQGRWMATISFAVPRRDPAAAPLVPSGAAITVIRSPPDVYGFEGIAAGETACER
jgi:hypothetical protein